MAGEQAAVGGNGRVHGPKLGGRHLLVEAADPANQGVRNKQAYKVTRMGYGAMQLAGPIRLSTITQSHGRE